MKNWKKLSLLLALFAVVCLGIQPGLAQPPIPSNFCRFGIGVANGLTGYDLTQLGVGSYLDWAATRSSLVPATIQFFYVLRVGDSTYNDTLSSLPAKVAANPGAVWIVGNEPDAEVAYQDHIPAHVYAQRYYALATIIRSLDPTALIAFGTVIQPTPIRLYYLDLTLNHLDTLTGSRAATHDLIDVLSIHNFILNEQPIYQNGVPVSWGAGVPPGYAAGVWPAPFVITIGGSTDETYKTHSIEIFRERIIQFRAWMKQEGLRDRPLWITEYGSLFPSVGTSFLTVSDAETADFLQQTMDFMLSAKDANTGYQHDDNRLVQHFVWYSLNENRARFGGSLYDPNTGRLTPVGERYVNYDPPALAGIAPKPADLYVLQNSLIVAPVSRVPNTGLVNYRVWLRASNAIASEYRTQIRARLYDNDVFVGEQVTYLPRCAGQSVFDFMLYGRQPTEMHTLRFELSLLGGNGPEINPGDNQYTFPPFALPEIFQYRMPIIHR